MARSNARVASIKRQRDVERRLERVETMLRRFKIRSRVEAADPPPPPPDAPTIRGFRVVRVDERWRRVMTKIVVRARDGGFPYDTVGRNCRS